MTVPRDRLVAVESATKVMLEHREFEHDQVMVYRAQVDHRTGLDLQGELAARS